MFQPINVLGVEQNNKILNAMVVVKSGFAISGRQSYFATINFVLTTMILNVIINFTPGVFYLFRCHWHLKVASNFDLWHEDE